MTVRRMWWPQARREPWGGAGVPRYLSGHPPAPARSFLQPRKRDHPSASKPLSIHADGHMVGPQSATIGIVPAAVKPLPPEDPPAFA